MVAAEMAVNFVMGNLRQWGVQDIETLIIEGHNQFPNEAEMIVQNGLELVKKRRFLIELIRNNNTDRYIQ